MNDKNYFTALTGVRAFAAYMVFFHHQNQTNIFHLPVFIFDMLKELHVGVTVFFVLSGFLITYRYYDSVVLTRHWLKKYAINRIARIYPMYFLLTACAFLFQVFYEHIKPGSATLLSNLFLVKGFFDQLKFTGIPQSWSLTVEECFYFSAPLIFLFQQKTRKSFLLIFLLLGLGFLLVQFNSGSSGYAFMGSNRFMLIYTFFGRSFEFFTGIYLALYLKNISHKNRENKSIIYTMAGVVSFTIILATMAFVASAENVKFSIYSYPGILLNNFMLPLAIVLFFYGLLTEKTCIRKMMEWPLLQLLGKSSYVFYLIHLGFVVSIIDIIFPIKNVYLHLVVLFILLNLASIMLYKWVEDPSRVWVKNIFIPSSLKLQKR